MSSTNVPDFLIKSTLTCMLVVLVVMVPLFINAITTDQLLLALLIFIFEATCLVNVWNGFKNKYNLFINSYFVSPLSTVAITYTFFQIGVAASYWPFVLVLSYYFLLPEKRAWIFTAIALLIFLPSSWYVLPHESAFRFCIVLILTSIVITLSMREIYKLHGLLEKKAITDTLTGLFNRVSLKPYLKQTMAQSKRSGMPMTLISIDIDHFKQVNDTLGHDKGDEVLENLAALLQSRVRDSDRVFRVGGEEFLVCLYDTNEENSVVFAENLREQIEQHFLLSDYPITISAGVSGFKHESDLNSWLKSCDLKLYQAKSEGRNRVIV